MSKIVLITGIGGDISQGVATILRECRPDLRLIGIDVHSQHGGHRFVDFFTTVPSASDAGYLEAVRAVVIDHSVDVVIPMSEPELAALHPFAELAPGVRWISAGPHVVEAGLDKLETARALAKMGLPVPWTIPVDEGGPAAIPCVLKNRFGSGSRAEFGVENDEDVVYLAKRYPEAVFQEMLLPANREVTCAVYRARDGRISTLQMLRRPTGGFTGWAKVIDDPEASKMCEQIAEGLDLRGAMNVQLRLTDSGPRVFEINPRFSSTVLMRHRLGFTDVLWALDEVDNQAITFPPNPTNKIMVRVQGALILDDNESGVVND
jgi:carbamoyl-phosphate synthase large subunit